MTIKIHLGNKMGLGICLAAGVALLLAACGGGGGGDGAHVDAKSQSIAFGAAPTLTLGNTATVSATATSGLAVTYSSTTATVCTVDGSSGVVTGVGAGTCTIAGNQSGNATYAPAAQVTQSFAVSVDPHQTIAFGVAPALTLGGSATVSATASSGLAVIYSSLTPPVCSVNSGSGLVTDLTSGTCTIAADQPGNGTYVAAPQATQSVIIAAPSGTAPGAPTGVSAALGNNASTVVVSIGAVDSGGSAITGYTVVSSPAGVTVTAASAPVTVTCPSSCAGYAFSIYATNAIGAGTAAAAVDVLTVFNILTTLHEPDTQPRDSIFTGSFTLNSTTGAVTNLAGDLTESMTGNAVGSAPYYDMTRLALAYPLQTWHDATLGGTFAATFKNATTATFYGGTWKPEDGVAVAGIYSGYVSPFDPGVNAGNAYALIFVPDNPFAALTQAQINKLSYADCAPGGMMGATCMTGTSVAGYGAIGTMSGYPVSQVITKR
jgi:hypothetical protein